MKVEKLPDQNKACSGNYSKLFQRIPPPAAFQAEAGALQPEKWKRIL
jgi:hypothetical protein